MLEGFTVLLFSLHNLSCLLPWDPILVTWSCVPVQSILQLGKCCYVKRLWRLISEMIYLQRLREPLYEFFFD